MGVPIRQRRPHRVVLNYTTDRLPLAFLFPSASQSQFNFQETPTPLSITRHVQSEEQVLDVSGKDGWEDENEDEERVEDNNEEVAESEAENEVVAENEFEAEDEVESEDQVQAEDEVEA